MQVKDANDVDNLHEVLSRDEADVVFASGFAKPVTFDDISSICQMVRIHS